MDDRTLLALTETRLNNFRRRKSLYEQAAQKILVNIGYFAGKQEENEKLASLPAALRNKLLLDWTKFPCPKFEGEISQYRKVKEVFKLLLDERTIEVNFNSLMTFFPNEPSIGKKEGYIQLVQIIATTAPNIRSLTINQQNEDGSTWPEFTMVDLRMWQAIEKLHNLRKLEILSFSLTYEGLRNICKKLKNLEYVHTCHIHWNPTGSEDEINDFKESFSNLKALLFCRVIPPEEQRLNERMINLCIQHLPKLEYVEGKLNDEDHMVIGQEISKPPLHLSSLRHLSLRPSVLFDFHYKFPRVVDLTIDCKGWIYSEQDIDAMLKFPNITGLCLKNFPTDQIVDRFLRSYGQRLKILILSQITRLPMRCDVGKIFQLCPKLENLTVHGVDLTDNSKPIHSFAKLKELHWIFRELPVYNTSNLSRRKISLSNILSAPLLEKVKLVIRDFDLDDLKKLTTLITERKILGCLNNFHIDFLIEEYTKIFKKENLREIFNLFKIASAFLPRLIELEAKCFACCTSKGPGGILFKKLFKCSFHAGNVYTLCMKSFSKDFCSVTPGEPYSTFMSKVFHGYVNKS